MEEIGREKFDNLDSWVPDKLAKNYQKEVLDKLLKSSKKEEAKQPDRPNQPVDPFPIGGGIPRGGP
jgi:hypothetical protein